MRTMRILVVDDDPDMLSMVMRMLRAAGMEVVTSNSSIGVSNLVRRVEPDIVLLDVNIPELSVDALLGLIRRTAPPKTRFVLYSSRSDAELRTIAQRVNADGWISKSTEMTELADYLRKLAPKL